jgi:cytochrome c556
MPRMKKTAWIQAVCTVAVLTTGGFAAWAADDVLKTRQENMKTKGAQMKAIKGIIEAGGNPADVVGPANKIAEVAALIPSLFPQGTGEGDTGARPEIWEKWDEFTKLADDLKTQAQMLASAGQSGDLATVRAQFAETGKVCGTCHETFKKKRD